MKVEIIEETDKQYCNIHYFADVESPEEAVMIMRRLRRLIASPEPALDKQVTEIKKLMLEVDVDMVKLYDTYGVEDSYENTSFDIAANIIVGLKKKIEMEKK